MLGYVLLLSVSIAAPVGAYFVCLLLPAWLLQDHIEFSRVVLLPVVRLLAPAIGAQGAAGAVAVALYGLLLTTAFAATGAVFVAYRLAVRRAYQKWGTFGHAAGRFVAGVYEAGMELRVTRRIIGHWTPAGRLQSE